MNSQSTLPHYTAESSLAVGVFNTSMGKLQRQLYQREYTIFQYAPVFENGFIQVSRKGEMIDVHNRARLATLGIIHTSPYLTLPSVMLLARSGMICDYYNRHSPAAQDRGKKLTRIFLRGNQAASLEVYKDIPR